MRPQTPITRDKEYFFSYNGVCIYITFGFKGDLSKLLLPKISKKCHIVGAVLPQQNNFIDKINLKTQRQFVLFILSVVTNLLFDYC